MKRWEAWIPWILRMTVLSIGFWCVWLASRAPANALTAAPSAQRGLQNVLLLVLIGVLLELLWWRWQQARPRPLSASPRALLQDAVQPCRVLPLWSARMALSFRLAMRESHSRSDAQLYALRVAQATLEYDAATGAPVSQSLMREFADREALPGDCLDQLITLKAELLARIPELGDQPLACRAIQIAVAGLSRTQGKLWRRGYRIQDPKNALLDRSMREIQTLYRREQAQVRRQRPLKHYVSGT